MILYELTGCEEEHPVYRDLESSNGNRHYSFLQSAVETSISIERPCLSQTLIKAFNYHAIACLHTKAGEFRTCEMRVGPKEDPDHPDNFLAPSPHRVPDLMDDFVNLVNLWWHDTHPITLAAYSLWRLNYIHPFINGNGRTARATCYFILCVAAGGWLGGKTILPELLRRDRDQYVQALKEVDELYEKSSHPINVEPLEILVNRLLEEQLAA